MYLAGFTYWKPSFNNIASDKVLSGDLHYPHHLGVGVVLVPHVEHDAVSSVADMNLENLVPLWIEIVEDDGGLSNPVRRY